MSTFDSHKDNATILATAKSVSDRAFRLDDIASRMGKLARRLERFDFASVAQPLAGLLTRRENHAANPRIEVLVHLAAMSCGGDRAPSRSQLRDWMKIVSQDPVGRELEDPVEDVFVSNVVYWSGNARLFEGAWNTNGCYVQTCINGLSALLDRPWARTAQRRVMAMLRLSEAVAERAGAARYTLSETSPRKPVRIAVATADRSAGHVGFGPSDLRAMAVSDRDLEPFVFRPEDARALRAEKVGHSALERRPLTRRDDRTIVVLPNAIGAAIRRFLIEQATAVGDLEVFQAAIDSHQRSDLCSLGCAEWGIDLESAITPFAPSGAGDCVGTFDDGGYVHLVHVPDDLSEVAREGLDGIQRLDRAIGRRIGERAAALASEPGYRRGLTLLVHGGVGRGFRARGRSGFAKTATELAGLVFVHVGLHDARRGPGHFRPSGVEIASTRVPFGGAGDLRIECQ